MHRTFFAAVIAAFGITFIQIASAADLPRKAPAYTPVFSWTGCYIGGNIGYGWGRETVSISNLGETTGVPELALPSVP
jgi:outer membrane immunogenic protein